MKNISLKSSFPLVFRVCAHELHNSSARFRKYGYKYDYDYFNGKSMYNNTLFGFNGHTEDGKTIGSFDGKLV